MFNSTLLAKFILRRDRIQLPIWMIGIIGFSVGIIPAFIEMFPTELERLVMAETMQNPAMVAMVGPIFDLEYYTIGALTANMMLLFMAVTVALMNIFFVVRHTRDDEENGRIELIRSMATGRLSTLVATFMVAFLFNVVLAVLIGLGTYAVGDESMNFNGSMLYGAVHGVTGLVFASFTALFGQLSKNTRTVLAYSFAFLGVNYLIRGIGDVSNELLSKLTPLGLPIYTEVFVNNYWWPIWATLGVAVITGAFALYLNSLRDLGSGFIAEKPGRTEASALLQSPAGLTLKLVRSTVITWAIVSFLIGVSYGSIFGDLESFFANNEMLQQILPDVEGVSLTEQFMTMLMVIISIFGAMPTIMLVLRIRGEEKKERLENVLTRIVSRPKVLFTYMVAALFSSVAMNFLGVLGLYVASSAVMDDPVSFRVLFDAGMSYIPAIWVFMALALFLVGFLPKLTNLIWLYLGFTFFVVYLGGILQLPEWIANLSPFGHIPQIPLEPFRWEPLLAMTAIAVIFGFLGFVGFRRRDIHA